MLTAYPPSNPNRDETGQPKSAIVGGVNRQRISSQAIKRAWRLSEPMAQVGKRSLRTRRLGTEVKNRLLESGVKEKDAQEWASALASAFGSVSKKSAPNTEEIVILGPEEWDAAMALATALAKSKKAPNKEELESLPKATTSIDCAMFGRMRAAHPNLNVDAAVAVSHPMTVNRVTVESDFWTAVDDLKGDSDDQGAGGMDEREFGSGVYYTYVEIAGHALKKNLGNDAGEALAAIGGLIEAMATITPSGHRTSFNNNVRASYMRVEIGQPTGNLMMAAFETPIVGTLPAIEALRRAADLEGKAYGLTPQIHEFSVPEGIGTLAIVRAGVVEAVAKQLKT
jgi:CRISPR system Cascade subunit CasC